MSDPKPTDQLDHIPSRPGDVRSEGYMSQKVPRADRADNTRNATANARAADLTELTVNRKFGLAGGQVGGGNYTRQPIIVNNNGKIY